MCKQLASSYRGGRLRKLVTGVISASASVALLSLLPAAGNLLLDGGNSVALRFDSVLAADDEEQRAPPATRQSQTLGQQVYRHIEDVMELRDAEPPDLVGARAALDEVKKLYDRDRLNDFEKYTMWQFYASLDLEEDDMAGALDSYRQILTLEELRPDQLEVAWLSVGTLHLQLEEFREAIDAFNSYNEIAVEPNEDVYYRLALAYYQLEETANALPPLLRYMELMREKQRDVPRNAYSMLLGLYLDQEQWEEGRQVLREMVVLFNEASDWSTLAQIEGQLENFNSQAQLLYVADAASYLESESQVLVFSSLMNNNDNPFGCAERIVKGFEADLIEQDEDNLSFVATCYQLAREDEKAAPLLARAAELSDDGELHARLGRIYMTMSEWEQAIEAMRTGINRGVDREDQVYLSLARVYMELNRFDEGIEAARAAGRDSRSSDAAASWITVLNNEKQRYELSQQRRQEFAEYFR